MQPKKLVAGTAEYTVRQLSFNNERDVQALCVRCSDYSLLVEGTGPTENAGRELLSETPPDKEIKDKVVLGVYNDNRSLVAVADLIKDYKAPREWTLGLMMVDPCERGSGLGSRLHEYVKKYVSDANGNRLRIGVVEENHSARRFWARLGYVETGKVHARYGIKDHVVIIMGLSLE